jgi:peptidoglycan/LPS O-acetylase OafA/YrhL
VDAPPRSERLPELDALRGIAAFLVLIHHMVQLVPPIPTPEDIPAAGWLRYTLTSLTPLRIIEFGRPAVLFFFVLSGFVLTRALLRSGSPGLLAFAAQRTVRLGLPVVVSVLLSVGLYQLAFRPEVLAEMGERSLYTWLEPPTLGAVLSNGLLLASNEDMRLNVVLWSLVHEWRLTLFLPLILLFRGRVPLLLGFALACAALGVMGGATENQVLLGPDLHSTIPASFYFFPAIAAGAALALAGPPVLDREQRAAAALATLALFCMASDAAIYLASVLLIVLAIEPGPFRSALRLAPALWLGRVSFSLYLVHVPVLVAGLHLLHGEAPAWAVPLLGGAAALLAAAVMHRLVEVPARYLGRRVEQALARPVADPAPAVAQLAAPRTMAPVPRPSGGAYWESEGGIGMRRNSPAAAVRH